MASPSSDDPYEVLRFQCPHCPQRLKVRFLDRGKPTRCPRCGAAFTIPWHDPSPPAPMLPVPQPRSTYPPTVQPNAAAPCGCLAALALLVAVPLGLWWVLHSREQPAPAPVPPDSVVAAAPGSADPEPHTSAQPRPETLPAKKTEPDREKVAASTPLPPEGGKLRAATVVNPENADARPNAADKPKSFLSLRALAKEFLESFENWRSAIASPEQFLTPGFTPTEDQLVEGTAFYLTVFTVSFLFFAPLIFTYKGEAADKTKVAVNGAIGLMFTGILAMTWYFAFWLVGGRSTISGTFLAYIYAAGPYLPLFTLSSLLIFTGLPERYRRSALNPATAQAAMNAAVQDLETSKGPVILGGCAAVGIMMWSMIVVFRCFSYVHDVSAWRLVGAIVISLILSAPVGALLKRLSALIQSAPGVSDSLSEGF